MAIIKGKVVKIKLDVEQEKKAGGTWEAHVLHIDTGEEDPVKILINVKSPAGKFLKKLDLEKGDKVTVVKEKNDKGYETVIKVMKGDVDASKSGFNAGSKGKNPFDGEGAARGNAITNAVNLAIAVKKDKASIEDVLEFAKALLKVGERLKESPFKASAKDGDDDLSDDDSDKKSDDDDDEV